MMPDPVAFAASVAGAYAVWSLMAWLIALYLRPVFAEDDAGSGRWLVR